MFTYMFAIFTMVCFGAGIFSSDEDTRVGGIVIGLVCAFLTLCFYDEEKGNK